MITCQDARQLFDRYLDGELSPALQTELHAHQLSCPMCQSELAMLEACGDVVALDRCEPSLSESFTDRVLLARRSQLVPRPRRWGRMVLLVGSPMAAAASILLAFMLIVPSTPQVNRTAVLGPRDGGIVAAPTSVQEAMKLTRAEDRSEQAERELADTPPMPAVGFMEALLARVVEQSQDGVEGVRGSVAELELLLRQSVLAASEQLVAQGESTRGKGATNDAPADRPIPDLEFLGPPGLNPEPASEPTPHLLLLDPL